DRPADSDRPADAPPCDGSADRALAVHHERVVIARNRDGTWTTPTHVGIGWRNDRSGEALDERRRAQSARSHPERVASARIGRSDVGELALGVHRDVAAFGKA